MLYSIINNLMNGYKMKTTYINIAKDFSPFPINGGKFSGKSFRQNHLIKALDESDKVVITFDGVKGLPTSWLEEVFSNLPYENLQDKIIMKNSDTSYNIYTDEVLEYIKK